MGFWKNLKESFLMAHGYKYNLSALNAWLQFCIEHDKEMIQFFDEVSIIIGDAIIEFFPVLQAKRKQCVYSDEYDVVHNEEWLKEIDKFVDSVILKRLDHIKLKPMVLHGQSIQHFIELHDKRFCYSDESFTIAEACIFGFDIHEDSVSEKIDQLENDIVECEKDAKENKDDKDYKKFLSLKRQLIQYRKGTFVWRHTCVPAVFECLINFDLDKSGFIKPQNSVWTEAASEIYGLKAQIDLLNWTIEYYKNIQDTQEKSDEEIVDIKDMESYFYMFKVWVSTNVSMILENIFSTNQYLNRENMIKKIHSDMFGKNKTKQVQIPKTGLDYEKIITAKLKDLGFNAKTTKASGDQGADVLADKGGVSFAIQCKLYTKPVGNKAVQEANAARDFYKKDYAVVVSNAGYTKSARTAANACDVILINDTQLEKLLEYI